MYHWMHLLHAIQQASQSAHRIIRILIADLRDRKKIVSTNTDIMQSCAPLDVIRPLNTYSFNLSQPTGHVMHQQF
jgi:hypothetical protein